MTAWQAKEQIKMLEQLLLSAAWPAQQGMREARAAATNARIGSIVANRKASNVSAVG